VSFSLFDPLLLSTYCLQILDQYKESHDTREREGAAASSKLPHDVILVGHSMGGFVARAAAVHPRLRKSAVQTILTLSSPHQSPPLALQPSLGHYFAQVNREWKKGYEVQTSPGGNYVSDPLLSGVVVVSISGGYNDYQVRKYLLVFWFFNCLIDSLYRGAFFVCILVPVGEI
jgi:pimeloyl-ACP methyl ester carboxylesterase